MRGSEQGRLTGLDGLSSGYIARSEGEYIATAHPAATSHCGAGEAYRPLFPFTVPVRLIFCSDMMTLQRFNAATLVLEPSHS
jgi:hypothetical protein